MALVGYGNSDEESDVKDESSQKVSISNPKSSSSTLLNSTIQSQSNGTTKQAVRDVVKTKPSLEGPIIGPTIPSGAPFSGLLDEDADAVPQSPYSANQALLRDLTLPTLPNYDIPPSPPGSPVESTNAKFRQFLELKKQGVHFNEKLVNSAAVKNPALMQNLMEFVGIDQEAQYATSLPRDLWDPVAFPAKAFKLELARSQQEISKKKEQEKMKGQRDSVDFVPAAAGEPSTRGGPPGKFGQKSAAERVMAGLERRSNSPQVQNLKRKSRFDN